MRPINRCLLPLALFAALACTPGGAPPATDRASAGRDAVPPSRAIPASERGVWRQRLGWPESCDRAFEAGPASGSGVRFYELAPNHLLVRVTCAVGAYQGYSVFVDLDQSRTPAARPLTFTVLGTRDGATLTKERTSEVWGETRFDPEAHTLTVLNLFRSLGDCGVLSTYAFRDATPLLVQARAKLACDGRGSDEPQRWSSVPLEGDP